MPRLAQVSVPAALVVMLVGCQSQPTPSTPGTLAVKDAPKASAPTDPAKAARRLVKTTADPEAGSIDKTPKDTTIEEIVAQKAPDQLAGRSGPFETSTWKVKATLSSVRLMKDGDYYLVMKGDKGGETVVEVPDPANCKGSPFEADITAARKVLEEKYHPTKDIQKINQKATITGVGFLGWGKSSTPKKKTAETHSGPRLMPGTGFSFEN